jgi:hypothetical protein
LVIGRLYLLRRVVGLATMKQILPALGLLILMAPSVLGCRPEVPTQRRAFRSASAVFIGEVVDINQSDFQPIRGKNYFVTVKFKIIQYWKGRGSPFITVDSEQGLLSCNLYAFRTGERYLVYAKGIRHIVYTGSSRSAPLSLASYVDDEMKMLGKAKKPRTT